MKNAEDVAVKILDDHWGICEGRDELQIAIAKSLQAAYQKGAEEMRGRCLRIASETDGATLIRSRNLRPAEIVANGIRSLPLHPEGGGR